MTAIEHYLEHHGWVRCDCVTECWERGDLLLDLDDPNHLAELSPYSSASCFDMAFVQLRLLAGPGRAPHRARGRGEDGDAVSAIDYGPLWESIAKVADRDKLAPDHPLRVLGEAITSGDDEGFAPRWLAAEAALREYEAHKLPAETHSDRTGASTTSCEAGESKQAGRRGRCDGAP